MAMDTLSSATVYDAGFDVIIIDGAKLSMEENITMTKQCVDYARVVTKNTGQSTY